MSAFSKGASYRPPITPRPQVDDVLSTSRLLQLWLDSISTVRMSGSLAPANAPLTPDEAERLGEFIKTNTAPATLRQALGLETDVPAADV
ncbi:MAG: hypothetical protein ABIS86_19160 [Streptosporangiaceae bacterium]